MQRKQVKNRKIKMLLMVYFDWEEEREMQFPSVLLDFLEDTTS